MESSPSQMLADDNKDVLIERLHDLILRLSDGTSIEESTISAIHAGVDKIEILMKRTARSDRRPPEVTSPAASMHSRNHSDDSFWGSPLPSPTQHRRMRIVESPTSPIRSHKRRPEMGMSTAKAAEIAKAAEDLTAKLLVTIEEPLIFLHLC
jgi:hypothetical protein